MLTFRQGHWLTDVEILRGTAGEIPDVFRSFPHLCPGDGCAVKRWLATMEWRAREDRVGDEIAIECGGSL